METNKNLEKLTKKHLLEQQRRIKPGQCIKYIRCVIDPKFLDFEYGSEILSQLNSNEIKYTIEDQGISPIISWERSDQQTLIGSTNPVALTEKYVTEKQKIYLITANELLTAIEKGTIKHIIKEVYAKFPDVFLTIIIYGLKKILQKANRYEIEKILAEIQIEYKCSHRFHETSADVAQVIVQFSKAIAEIPFKKQQTDKVSDIDTFLLNDNRDCVRVEGTAGLSRLWQSHLTRLPQVTLEVAETIITEYPNPVKLIEVYKHLNEKEGKDILSDLSVRRAQGPLQVNRRLGPELSRKLYTLYNSKDPNDIL